MKNITMSSREKFDKILAMRTKVHALKMRITKRSFDYELWKEYDKVYESFEGVLSLLIARIKEGQ